MTDNSMADWRDYRMAVLQQLGDLQKGLEAQERALHSLQVELAKLETKMAMWAAIAMIIASAVAATVGRYFASGT